MRAIRYEGKKPHSQERALKENAWEREMSRQLKGPNRFAYAFEHLENIFPCVTDKSFMPISNSRDKDN